MLGTDRRLFDWVYTPVTFCPGRALTPASAGASLDRSGSQLAVALLAILHWQGLALTGRLALRHAESRDLPLDVSFCIGSVDELS